MFFIIIGDGFKDHGNGSRDVAGMGGMSGMGRMGGASSLWI